MTNAQSRRLALQRQRNLAEDDVRLAREEALHALEAWVASPDEAHTFALRTAGQIMLNAEEALRAVSR